MTADIVPITGLIIARDIMGPYGVIAGCIGTTTGLVTGIGGMVVIAGTIAGSIATIAIAIESAGLKQQATQYFKR